MGFLKNLILGKSLNEHLKTTKTIKINGVRFEIKKIDGLDYCDGSKILLKTYDLYTKGETGNASENIKKVKDHFRDVFMAGVVRPKLSRKEDGETIFVDEIFKDWDMAQKLYNEIYSFAYGKKKLIG